MRISCYVNGNPEIHKIAKADEWMWSSYKDYLNLRNGTLCNKNVVLKYFNNIEEYKNLTDMIIEDKQDTKEQIKIYEQ